MIRKQSITLLLVIILCNGCTSAAPAPSAVASALPRERSSQTGEGGEGAAAVPPYFAETPCWDTLPLGIAARCGYVTVPENRARPYGPDNSARLAVMILWTGDMPPAAAPTFELVGGPGQQGTALFAGLLENHRALLEQGYPPEEYAGQRRDNEQFKAVMDLFVHDLARRAFVIFDQRGAGRSEPSLDCRDEHWDVCFARLTAAGVDVAAYNTRENAADVNDIRIALGYDTINIQGGSYGTQLGLEVLRAYPQYVRAAVLDGVKPPQIDWSVEITRRYGETLGVLFEHCRADAACDAAYPKLESVFYELVVRLNRAPLDIEIGAPGSADAWRETVDGDDLTELLWNGLYDVAKIRYLPMLIHQLSAGDTTLLSALIRLQAAECQGTGMSWGMHYSVVCSEEWAFESVDELGTAAAALHPAIRDGVVSSLDISHTCAHWAVPPAPASQREPVRSDVPTLLVSGEFDPATPPAFAVLTAETLSHHYNYVFPGMGHTDGFLSLCWSSIISAFLDDPARAPDTTCIASMGEPAFVVEP